MALHIAIVGAGIGGLAAATALARAGHRVAVYDRFAAPAPVGSGLVIQPVGMAVLAALGLQEAALESGTRVHRLLGRAAPGGRRVLDVSYDAPGDPRFGLGIHRAALFEILHRAALEAGAMLHPGHAITGAEAGRLFHAGGGLGPFDLVVDAAGAGSPLSPLRARPLHYGALWATVDWPADCGLPYNELRQVYRRAERMLGILPLGQEPGRAGRRAALFWSLPAEGQAAWQAAGLASWRAEAMALWPESAPFVAQITDPAQMVMARYAHGMLRRPWSDAGRVIHIGDAAHRASPQLGQGANMALLDALALARALRRAQGEVALAAGWYAQARRWHVRSYQGLSRLFTPQYQSDSRLLPLARDRLLYPLSQVPPLPGLLTRLVCGNLLPPLGSLAD
jgi:2-polyprenyl-6-methoxyphenol hydroxylase-like FAD-dependent oxidoreductase